MLIATCVECDEEIEINDRPRRGLRIICPSCGARLEVANTTPLELELLLDEGEEDDDWDDEFGLDDDELDDDWDNDDLDDFDEDLDSDDDDDDDWDDDDDEMDDEWN